MFTSKSVAKLFESEEFDLACVQMLVRELLERAFAGTKGPTPEEARSFFSSFGARDPVEFVTKTGICIVEEGRLELHPLVGKNFDLYPHYLTILRKNFAVEVSHRVVGLGKYLRYIGGIGEQIRFLALNMGIPGELLRSGLESLYLIYVDRSYSRQPSEPSNERTLSEGLSKPEENGSMRHQAKERLDAIEKNAYLLSEDDRSDLARTFEWCDKVAEVNADVAEDLTRACLKAYSEGAIGESSLMKLERVDELALASTVLNSRKGGDPASVVLSLLKRELEPKKKRALVSILAEHFKSILIKEGLKEDADALVRAATLRSLDDQATISATLKNMNIWTPRMRRRLRGSSTRTIFVNDLSASMLPSFIGQLELFSALLSALEEFEEGDATFVTFAERTRAWSFAPSSDERSRALSDLAEGIGANTNINAALESLVTGIADYGSFSPPDEETIIFFVSDLERTAGDMPGDALERAVQNARRFFVAMPESHDSDLAKRFIDAGARAMRFREASDIPLLTARAFAGEF